MLTFGNETDIEMVYQGKQNLIKRPKKIKEKDYNDFKKFCIKKGYMKITNLQTIWVLENLVKPFEKNGVVYNNILVNMLIKDIYKEYKNNIKNMKKYNNLKKKGDLKYKLYENTFITY